MFIKYAKIDDYDDNTLNSFKNIIYTDKRNRIKNSNNQKYINKMIIGEILLKNLIEQHENIKYENLVFKINKYGKPFITNKKIFFNISHSFSYIICVINNKEIGCDIEKIRKTNLNTIKLFATDNEIKYILKSKQNIEKRLFEIYTLKEAYFKMQGKDLKNIKNIEFSLINNMFICSDQSVNVEIKYTIPNYIVAICQKKL